MARARVYVDSTHYLDPPTSNEEVIDYYRFMSGYGMCTYFLFSIHHGFVRTRT
jgi:hypothetical protein